MENEELEIISINEGNISSEHICCALGSDKKNKRRSGSPRRKKPGMCHQCMGRSVCSIMVSS